MSLHTDIKNGIKDAMKAKDAVRLSVLRGLSAAFTNELVAKSKMPSDELSDEDALTVIRRISKQRKDSIDQFKTAGRNDLVEGEQAELAILETFLPQMMSKEDIMKVAEAKKTEMGITDKAKIGMLMGAVQKELKGKADGGDVKSVVESLFS
jgi:uncharacterized protein